MLRLLIEWPLLCCQASILHRNEVTRVSNHKLAACQYGTVDFPAQPPLSCNKRTLHILQTHFLKAAGRLRLCGLPIPKNDLAVIATRKQQAWGAICGYTFPTAGGSKFIRLQPSVAQTLVCAPRP